MQNHINYIFHGISMINDHGSQYGSRHYWTNGKHIEAFQSLSTVGYAGDVNPRAPLTLRTTLTDLPSGLT